MLHIFAPTQIAAPKVPWKVIGLGVLVFAASFPLWH
jgi:hypothetical protein